MLSQSKNIKKRKDCYFKTGAMKKSKFAFKQEIPNTQRCIQVELSPAFDPKHKHVLYTTGESTYQCVTQFQTVRLNGCVDFCGEFL